MASAFFGSLLQSLLVSCFPAGKIHNQHIFFFVLAGPITCFTSQFPFLESGEQVKCYCWLECAMRKRAIVRFCVFGVSGKRPITDAVYGGPVTFLSCASSALRALHALCAFLLRVRFKQI